MIVSRSLAVAAIACFSFAGSAQAGPTLIFNFTETAVAAFLPPVGSVTLTQNGANSVNVFVDLPTGFGFVNTGSKTPFTFNLAGALTVAFTTPLGGNFIAPNLDALNLFYSAPGPFPATPFGNFSNAIEKSGGNGSSRGYFGDLGFTVTRTGGLSTLDFFPTGSNYFAADVANAAGNTGSIATLGPQSAPISTPEPATLAMFGVALAALAASRARRRHATT